jgi:DNA-binding MarR family transcriptional regulator
MRGDVTDQLVSGVGARYPDLDPSVYQVTARIARLGLYLGRRQEDVFERFGLNRGEVGVLGALRVIGPPNQMSPTRLGRALLLSSAGITSRIDRLERRGLIQRVPDPDDRRGVLIELTGKGQELVDVAIRANTASERELLTLLDPEELATLERLVRKMLAGLEPSTG